jgi:amino acid adenylation domain-containing protein/FkbM family methyltransferase
MAQNYAGTDQLTSPTPTFIFDRELIEERDYWIERLSRHAGDSSLRLDHKRPTHQASPTEGVPIPISDRLSRRLVDVTGGGAFLLYTTLLSAVKVCLYKYTGSSTIIVGSPGRSNGFDETQSRNMVAIIDEIDDRSSFRELLLEVRQTLLDAYSKQRYPFERLVKDIGLNVESGRCPFFDVVVSLADIHSNPLSVNNDVTVIFDKGSGTLRGSVLYRPELFERPTIDRFVLHLGIVLETMVKDFDTTIAHASIMTDAERRQVFVEWNDTRVEFAKQMTVPRAFELQVERSPESIAVVCGKDALTYRELNFRVNQLAHYLRDSGVRGGVPVVVCLEPSLDLVVGLLAILKAGGAYVPVDTTYPKERQAFMAEDSRAPVFLTHECVARELPPHESRIIALDKDWPSISEQSSGNPAWTVTEEDLAYVIYTSGSTGQPKGAGVYHRGVFNLLSWFISEFELTSKDHVLLISSFSFDLTQKNIFAPLIVGGQLHVFSAEYFDVSEITKSIAQNSITCLNWTPSAFYPVADALSEASPKDVASLRYVFLGGEPISARRLWGYISRHNAAEIVNTYGPTECSDISTFCRLRPFARFLDAPVPIGRPIANALVYILDNDLAPRPIGAVGELCIGGSGVGMGYLHKPDLTADKFIPNPFDDAPGSRMYKTGDLARYLPDGNIEFLGRTDRQIKVRGFRIEMAEVEAALELHPAVREAVVLATEYAPGDQRLVGYVVPSEETALPVRRLLGLESEGKIPKQVRYELPNGMALAHLNRSETDFVYREIFEKGSYLRHGISLDEGACIFDVGANIGMFALYASQKVRDVQIYAFEPIPPIFELLRINKHLHDVNMKLFDHGIASEAGTCMFSFYPHASILSGRFADAAEERETVRNFLLTRGVAPEEADLSAEDIEELLDERLTVEPFKCQLKTLSQVIQENDVERIDLLKIDVEKSELDVLNGIASSDWPKIRQVVVEVHDTDGRLERVKDLLERNQFVLAIEQDNILRETRIYNVYAVRKEGVEIAETASRQTADPPANCKWSSPELLIADLRSSLQSKLPEYMVPSAFVLLQSLPLTPNGKVDVRAFPRPASLRTGSGTEFIAPRNHVEARLAQIWAEVLHLDEVGVNDNFFDLGGHSLLATQVVSRVRDAFQVKVPLKDFFAGPTIAEIAMAAVRSIALQADGEKASEILRQLEEASQRQGAA